VTKRAGSNGKARDVSDWSGEALLGMLQRRGEAWESVVEHGRVPGWLVDWIQHCKALHPSATPDYDYLRELIADGECAAVVAAAKAARERAWQEEMAAEE